MSIVSLQLSRRSSRSGFTIVELLIVIAIIAILAALTIVAFNGIVRRAQESGVISDTRQASATLDSQKDDSGLYPASCSTVNIRVSEGNAYECTVNAARDQYCIGVEWEDIRYYATEDTPTPTEGSCSGYTGVPVASSFTQISAVYNTTCGITESDQVYCWGNNTNGKLGIGVTGNRNVPTAIVTSGALSGKTVDALSISSYGLWHMCAIAEGDSFCWGNNYDGQVGNGTNNGSGNSQYLEPTATTMSGALSGKTVTQIATGYYHTCAIADGEAFCWGGGTAGELGNGASSNSAVPVAVSTAGVLSGKTVTALSPGYFFDCAIADGEAFCWGTDNGDGVLGNGVTGATSNVPVAVSTAGVLAGKTVTDITSGERFACVLADGAPYCWGDGSNGALGNNSTTDSNVPVAVNVSGVLAGKTITDIESGGYHTCVLADGQPYCWGWRSFAGIGALGDNIATNSYSAVPVAVYTGGALAGTTSTSLVSGLYHTCVLASGQPYCWGSNSSGQIGNGLTAASPVPLITTLP